MDLSTNDTVVGGSDPNITTTDHQTNKRKHCNISTNSFGGEASLFKDYRHISSDEKVSLVILKQPEKQHRAR